MYYIPELKYNMLSMGQLQDKGITILIQHGKCKVFHPIKGLIIQSEMRKTGCRRLQKGYSDT